MSLLTLLQNPVEDTSTSGSVSDNISLYLLSTAPSNANISLYVNGIGGQVGNVDLYTIGSPPVTTGLVNLYANGIGFQSGGVDLFISGDPINSNINLYTIGIGYQATKLNLSCLGPAISPAQNGSITCYVAGGTTQGITNNIPLYIKSGSQEGSLNLSIIGQSSAPITGKLNLSISGYFANINKGLDLVLFNDSPSLSLPLFIRGEGLTFGAIPFGSSLNLFINRNVGDAISLFLQNIPPTTNNIDLFCMGAYIMSANVPLVIAKTIGAPNQAVSLYTHGF